MQEPAINLRCCKDFFNVRSSPHRLLNLLKSVFGRNPHCLQQRSKINCRCVGRKLKNCLFALQRTQCLHQSFGERTANRHCFANALHRRSKTWISISEFFKGKPWSLHDDVIQRWLKRSRSDLRNIIHNFVERVSDRQFGSNLCDRKARSFRCKCARSRDSWVHLDNDYSAIIGIYCELNVAATCGHTNLANNIDG